MEAYNDQMKGEIAVTRRATYKAEESITQLEGGKRLQDEMIDKLNEQLKRSQEELALNEVRARVRARVRVRVRVRLP